MPTLVSSSLYPVPHMPRRFVPLATAATMSLIVAAVVTAVLVAANTGVDHGFAGRWLRSYVIAWPVAFPLVYLLAPRLRRRFELLAA